MVKTIGNNIKTFFHPSFQVAFHPQLQKLCLINGKSIFQLHKMNLAWKGCRPNDHLAKGQSFLRCIPSAADTTSVDAFRSLSSVFSLLFPCLPSFLGKKRSRSFKRKHLKKMIHDSSNLTSFPHCEAFSFSCLLFFFGGGYVAPQPPATARVPLGGSLIDTAERGR